MLLDTAIVDFAKACTVNSTDSSFPARVATITEPTGSGVIELTRGPTDQSFNNLLVVPYALGSDNDTFNVLALGWRQVSGLWLPVTLAQVACTCCTLVGVAAQAVLNTEHFVDTITLTYGNAGVSVEVVTNANNLIAHFMVDCKGFEKVELIFDLGTTPTSMNALYAAL